MRIALCRKLCNLQGGYVYAMTITLCVVFIWAIILSRNPLASAKDVFEKGFLYRATVRKEHWTSRALLIYNSSSNLNQLRDWDVLPTQPDLHSRILSLLNSSMIYPANETVRIGDVLCIAYSNSFFMRNIC